MASISSMVPPVLLRELSSSLAAPRWSGSVLRACFAGHDRITSPCSISCSGSRKGAPRLVCAVAQEAAVAVDPSSEVARRLYVGNIPRTVTNDELAEVFGEHGSVEKGEVVYDKYSGKSRRFGFVTMSTVEDASAAVEKLDGSEIGGRKIKVNVTEKPLQTVDASLLQAEDTTFVDSPYKVYVGNLAKTVTTEMLTDLFSEKGTVLSAKVSRVPGTSKSSSFGFVSFSLEEDVEAAISTYNNKFLEGQRIRVNKA